MSAYLRHSFLVDIESSQSISYADNFASCFLGLDFTQLSSPSRTSLFLTSDETDNDFDTADINNGDNVELKPIDDWEDTVEGGSVDDQEDTVEGVDGNGGNTTTEETMVADAFFCLFFVTIADLPFFVFEGQLYCSSPWWQ